MQSSNKNSNDAIVKTTAVNVCDSPIAKTKNNIAKGNNVLIINFTIIKKLSKLSRFSSSIGRHQRYHIAIEYLNDETHSLDKMF
jgi:hypothetical protein